MVNPLVSVIIPNYNHAKYLEQRIQSVLNQTYQNFEVIILDDCSPDNGASRAVIEMYRDNPHISHVVYNEKNSGSTFRQWDKGIELAKGEIIWIAESDDYCEPSFLQEMIKCWQEHPDCSVVQAMSRFVDENGNDLPDNRVFSGLQEYYDGMEFIRTRFFYSNLHIPNASAVTFKRKMYYQIPHDYETYKAAGDRLFWIYMLELGAICQVMKPLNYFRQHTNKVTARKEVDGTQCLENYQIDQYLNKRGYIKGIYKVNRYKLNHFYIAHFPFSSEDVRENLYKLWFPWWKRLLVTYYIATLISKFYCCFYDLRHRK